MVRVLPPPSTLLPCFPSHMVLDNSADQLGASIFGTSVSVDGLRLNAEGSRAGLGIPPETYHSPVT